MGRSGPRFLRELHVERLRLPRGHVQRRAEMRDREDQGEDGRPRSVPRRAARFGKEMPGRRLRDHVRRPRQDVGDTGPEDEARRLRDRAHRTDGSETRGRQLGRLSGRRCAGIRVRDARVDPAHRACGARKRHLGLRGAAERNRGRHQPTLALDHDPDDGHDHGRDLLREGTRRRLRRRQGVRVPVRRAGDPDHRCRRFAYQSPGYQVAMAKISGAQCLADMLAGYGVTHVFMVPAVLRRTFAEMERRTKIKRIHTHGEKSAAYMADGYARASGRPGICMAQVIGALNLAAGLRDAWLAHSPVIAFTGGREAKTKFRAVYQEVDDVPSFEPVTKWNATVDAVERFPDMVRQAFRVAVSGAPGPVHLQFRGNEGQIDLDEADMEARCETQFARVPPLRPAPDGESVAKALALLQLAERPVIVAGGGVRASQAATALLALAEALQIPVATSLNGKDTIPAAHPLSVGVVGTYSRESANRVVAAADLVCFVGTEAGGMT